MTHGRTTHDVHQAQAQEASPCVAWPRPGVDLPATPAGPEKGLCVIDLDTVMPGYFISDVGDMMRTYLSSVSEEEKDLNKIEVREEFLKPIVEGYLQEMSNELSESEIQHFVYAGIFMLYMQAVRFLTDHLNNDKYYGAAYEDQNFVRANNQITLLQTLLEKGNILEKIVQEYLRQ